VDVFVGDEARFFEIRIQTIKTCSPKTVVSIQT